MFGRRRKAQGPFLRPGGFSSAAGILRRPSHRKGASLVFPGRQSTASTAQSQRPATPPTTRVRRKSVSLLTGNPHQDICKLIEPCQNNFPPLARHMVAYAGQETLGYRHRVGDSNGQDRVMAGSPCRVCVASPRCSYGDFRGRRRGREHKHIVYSLDEFTYRSHRRI